MGAVESEQCLSHLREAERLLETAENSMHAARLSLAIEHLKDACRRTQGLRAG